MPETPTIKFGTDGWRALIAEDFTDENLKRVARAVGQYLQREFPARKIRAAVGYDCRFASERFAQVAADVLSDLGAAVTLSAKPCPTPALAHHIKSQGLAGGMMLTASHNPFNYHGVKFRPYYGGTPGVEITKEIEQFANHEPRPGRGGRKKKGDITTVSFEEDYLRSVRSLVDFSFLERARAKCVIDFMHGSLMGYPQALFKNSALDIIAIRATRDPRFGAQPNGEGGVPEPVGKHLKPTIEAVRENGADFGVAFDGDGDRIAIIDETGGVISAQELLPLLTEHLCQRKRAEAGGRPGGKAGVARTLCTSMWVDKVAAAYGIPCHETPVGFKYISDLMLDGKAFIGGEESGGIGFADHLPERDALVAFVMFLELVAVRKMPVTKIREKFREQYGNLSYDRVDVKISVEESGILARQAAALEAVLRSKLAISEVVSIDGLKFKLGPDAWVMLRESGTEPLIRIYAEAPTAGEVENLLAHAQSALAAAR